jgi:hypothetical protein
MLCFEVVIFTTPDYASAHSIRHLWWRIVSSFETPMGRLAGAWFMQYETRNT